MGQVGDRSEDRDDRESRPSWLRRIRSSQSGGITRWCCAISRRHLPSRGWGLKQCVGKISFWMDLGPSNGSQSFRRKLPEENRRRKPSRRMPSLDRHLRFHVVSLGRIGYLTALRKPRIFASVIAFLRRVSAVLYIVRLLPGLPKERREFVRESAENAVPYRRSFILLYERTAFPIRFAYTKRLTSAHRQAVENSRTQIVTFWPWTRCRLRDLAG